MEENKVMEQKIENEDELFHFVEYSPEAAEMIGYSDYSYWKSVFQNFLKKKSAVIMSCVFIGLVVFSFIALAIGKYDYASLVTDSSKAFINPNSEYWFGTDNIGRDYWCQVWYAAQTSIKLALIVGIGECAVGITIGCFWLCPQAGHLLHRTLQHHQQRSADHLHDPDRADDRPELHHHVRLLDRIPLVGNGT